MAKANPKYRDQTGSDPRFKLLHSDPIIDIDYSTGGAAGTYNYMVGGQPAGHPDNGRDESGDYTTCRDMFIKNEILYETNNLESSGSNTARHLDRMFKTMPNMRKMFNDFKKSLHLNECFCDRARTTIEGCTCRPMVKYKPLTAGQTMNDFCTSDKKCL